MKSNHLFIFLATLTLIISQIACCDMLVDVGEPMAPDETQKVQKVQRRIRW